LKLEQLVAPGGGAYGATRVDSLFLSFLKDLIPDTKHKDLFDNNKATKLKVLEEWEKMKQKFDPSKPRASPHVLFDGACMMDFFEDHDVDLNLRTCVEHWNAERAQTGLEAIEMRGERRLLIPSKQVEQLFRPCVNSIVEVLSNYVERTKDSTGEQQITIVLAGGFARSPFLRKELQAALNDCAFMLVNNPDLAIVYGAARFGTRHALGNDVVTARVLARSYAVGVTSEYKAHKPEHKRRESSIFFREGKKYIKDVSILVRKGKTVQFDAYNHRHGPFAPLTHSQCAVTFPILSSDHDTIVDRDDDHFVQVCSVSIAVDMSKPYEDRKYYCELCFGGTEIQCFVYESADRTAISVDSGTFSYD
jgi:hypothetical protein